MGKRKRAFDFLEVPFSPVMCFVCYFMFCSIPFSTKERCGGEKEASRGFDISPLCSRLSLVCVCFVFCFLVLFCFVLAYPCKNEAKKKDAQETKLCDDLSEARVDSFLM